MRSVRFGSCLGSKPRIQRHRPLAYSMHRWDGLLKAPCVIPLKCAWDSQPLEFHLEQV